mgnify:CR=1 FL=1
MLFMLALLVAGIGIPLWSVWKWRGGWRIAAAVPVTVIAFVALRIVVDTARDPTSHNLWPFEIIIFGAVAVGIIGALKIARRMMVCRHSSHAARARLDHPHFAGCRHPGCSVARLSGGRGPGGRRGTSRVSTESQG